MKSLAELEIIRKRAVNELNLNNKPNGIRVTVGMATCGLAAGAEPVMEAFVDELKKRNINDVRVTKTGCIGVCRLEPIADVINAKGEKITYVNLDEKKARRIVIEHLINGRPVSEYTIGKAEN
ncbi:MAG TPA: (2Fe-2S) ferredoxin domain-containing protein [Clostridia bacterium]